MEILKSEKIPFKKQFMTMYIVAVVLLIVTLIPDILSYSHYKKGQDAAIDLCVVAGIISESTVNRSTKKEVVDQLYSYFNDRYFLGHIITEKIDADRSLGKSLEILGFDCYYGTEYLRYNGFWKYIPSHLNIFFILVLVLIIVIFIANIWVLRNSEKEIIVDDDKVTCRKSKQKSLQFMIKDITSVETLRLHGLLIKGNAIKYKIRLIKNNEEIKETLLSLLSKVNEDHPTASPNIAEEISQLKKLMDDGIITSEEFELRKKKLLES